jgi:hypothetical protein
MVVDSDCEFLFRRFLTNHILIQVFLELKRSGEFSRSSIALLVPVIFDDRVANRYAFVAYVGPGIVTRRRNEFADDVLALVAERTTERVIGPGALQTGSPTYEKIKRSLALTGWISCPVYQH